MTAPTAVKEPSVSQAAKASELSKFVNEKDIELVQMREENERLRLIISQKEEKIDDMSKHQERMGAELAGKATNATLQSEFLAQKDEFIQQLKTALDARNAEVANLRQQMHEGSNPTSAGAGATDTRVVEEKVNEMLEEYKSNEQRRFGEIE